MGSFGERLRREREMRGVTLEEIAAATKIGTRNLKALEDEQFKILPGGIFNKGFVRAYARFLGLNEEQAVADYVAASGAAEESMAEIDSAQLLAQREEMEAKSKAATKEAKRLRTLESDEKSGIPWGALAGLVLIVVLAWGGRVGYVKYRAHREAQIQAQHEAELRTQQEAATAAAAAAQSAQQASAQSPTDSQAQPAQGTPTAGVPETESTGATSNATTGKATQENTTSAAKRDVNPSKQSPTSSSEAGKLVVSVRTRGRVWMSVKADGKQVMSGELAPSSQRDFEAKDHLTIKTGNAGATDLAVNGKRVPALGAEGQVRELNIKADGTVE